MKRERVLWIILLITVTAYGYSPQARNILMDIYQGDSVPYEITVLDGYSNEVVDLTGYLVKFKVKKKPTDANYVIDKNCTIASPTTGIATVTLSTAETSALNNYQYTAYVIYTDESGETYQTTLKSTLTVTQ